MGIVITRDNLSEKLKNPCSICMLVGYSVDHVNDVYWMLNLNNKRIFQTRDDFCLVSDYLDWCKNKAPSNDKDKDKDDSIGT
jgi:hypothetical protein